MSTDDLKLFLNAIHDLRITNAVTIASLVVLAYDIFLTFSEEVEYVWKAKWSSGKALFFLNRYPVLIVSIILIASDMDVTTELKTLVEFHSEHRDFLTKHGWFARCEAAYRLEGWSMLAFIIPVQLIFCLRTTALWERNKIIFTFLLVSMLACDCIIGVFIWMSERTGQFILPQWPGLQGLMGCYADISQGSSPKVIIPAVAALMAFDSAILVLTILRFVRFRKDGGGQGFVVRTLFRDGLIYYIVVLASGIANLILYAVLPESHEALIGTLVPILRTVMSVCASRLVLNLRGAIDRVRGSSSSNHGQTLMTVGGARSGSNLHCSTRSVRTDEELELQLHVGASLTYQYLMQVNDAERPGGPSSPIAIRPRSTTVVEVVSGKDTDNPRLADVEFERDKRDTITEGGTTFDIVHVLDKMEVRDRVPELSMGLAV